MTRLTHRLPAALVGLAIAICLAPVAALASAPESAWSTIAAMDAGPSKKPASREEAQWIARTHLSKQKRLIEEFLSKYPNAPQAFDAKLRLAGILATEGKMDNVKAPQDEAQRILTELERQDSTPASKRADAGFQRTSLFLQSTMGKESQMRESIVRVARQFVEKYPGDKRGPRLLVEAATVCDEDPSEKRALLQEARALTNEDSLSHRIADDLVRLDRLGKPLNLRFDTIQGGTFNTANPQGGPTVIVFWSAASPHSLMWMQSFRNFIQPFKNVRVATVSLDSDKSLLRERMKELRIEDWPTHFDGGGWQNKVARPLGINALPTVFILDKSGILRALNARDTYGALLSNLSRE